MVDIDKFWMDVYLAAIKNDKEDYTARRLANTAIDDFEAFKDRYNQGDKNGHR